MAKGHENLIPQNMRTKEEQRKVSIMGGKASDKENVMRQLEQLRVEFQRELARTLAFKRTPVLCYRLDRRFEKGDRVLELIKEAENAGE